MKKWMALVAVFTLLLTLFGVKQPVAAAGFTDVPARAAEEVNYLSSGKIILGYSPTKFGPNETVTRAQVAIFVGRTLQLDGTLRQTRFSDIGVGNVASGYIESLAAKGIMNGTTATSFSSSKPVTRGEMAKILKNAFGFSGEATKALLDLGIANGLADGTFGESRTITRADFSVLLARAVNPDFRLKPTAAFNKSLVSTANNLNVRTGPSTAFASVGKIAANTAVLGAHSVAGWTYVKAGDKTGFISNTYLRASGSVPTEPASPEKPANNGSSVAGQTIILDPGHGGSDAGAVNGKLYEKNVVLTAGLQVRDLFNGTPFTVKMTRSDDTFISLSDRAVFAKNNNGDVFVSIHANAATPAATGTETYYYAATNTQSAADSKLLAEKIQKRMIEAWGLRDRGVKQAGFQVIKYNTVPAALLELGFLTNAEDAAKMQSASQMKKMSTAIYNGILDYYKAKGFGVDSYYK